MANISFGERMRRGRIQNAWTQAELGEKIDVVGPTISNWEKEKTVPTKKQKDRIRGILGLEYSGKTTTPNASTPGSAAVEAPSAFGTWLSRTRLEKKMSVAELAKSSGVSGPAIYNIESGRIANPRAETVRRIEKALGQDLPAETKEELSKESTITGLGEFVDFDPHDADDRPTASGVYVLYDISERPIYVGEGGSIRKRIKDHEEKF
jgi:transcriptional regulator with XRE-family HTH domain